MTGHVPRYFSVMVINFTSFYKFDIWFWNCFRQCSILFLAHLTRRVMWAIAITWRLSSSSVVNFLAHLAKGHVSFCHHLASVIHRKLSHFNLLLRNHWANCNQTLVEWSLDGPLPKLCPVIPTSNQDGHQAKNRKKGGWNFNCPLLL